MKYRKIGGGILKLKDGRTIQPGEVFTADEQDLPGGVGRRLIKEVPRRGAPGPAPETVELDEEVEIQEKNVSEIEHVLKRRGKSPWWDVVNKVSGKSLNKKALRKEQAESLLKRTGE